MYVTLRHVSNSQELAKIDPDTGLQEIVGPSLNKVLVVFVQRNFRRGAVYISYSHADARDTQTGERCRKLHVRSGTQLRRRINCRFTCKRVASSNM